MRLTFSTIFASIIAVSFLFMSGCATMDKNECKTANWEIIGMEDGVAGRGAAYIGSHRRACADYGITPDLTAYQRGYDQGLIKFCTYDNGYAQGERGHSNNNVCPNSLKRAFNDGHKQGYQVYSVRRDIAYVQSQIANHNQRLTDIEKRTKQLEQQLVLGKTTPMQRVEILNETKSLNKEEENIKNEIRRLDVDLYRLQEMYAKLVGG
ncbi:MAG: DUF2799 domain-containing protein [Gammaproteobacteria bacterium]|nr:DUF2799 domain-containing protein [Gammaproteobacteria bacterium]MDH5629908.1 DUF2799 domain-containing protein [Gammaproteobacteria bacterium]